MTATATSSKQPTVRAHGAVRISLPAYVANDSNKLKQSIYDLVVRLGCPTCFSGADCAFQAERDFVIDPEGKLAIRNHDNPNPNPWRTVGSNSTVAVALGRSIEFDIEKVFQAVDKVNGLLGCPGCHSGFDIQYQNEVTTIGISSELQAVQYGIYWQISCVPPLGVGVIYNSGLDPLLRAEPALFDVLEVEPQTTWIESPNYLGDVRSRPEVLDYIAALPGHKLVHSVGTPVGGSIAGVETQLPLLRETVAKLGAPFVSEHLAFNLTRDSFTGFFLPPRQTAEGIRVYTGMVNKLRDALGVPLAVETGVNYLRPRPDEMSDGEFVKEVVRSSGCGILLDLHNVYCNQLNGRQKTEQFFSQIPLDSVWEVHLAGESEILSKIMEGSLVPTTRHAIAY